MDILKGTVVSNIDVTNGAKFRAMFPDLDENIHIVTHTSPYYTPSNGGVFAIPEEGTTILAYRDVNGEFYYMSTVLEAPQNFQVDGISEWKVVNDPRAYSKADKPCKVTFANQAAAGLHITRRYESDVIVNQVDLKSERGKRFSLNDSPNIDAITLKNEHGDGLLLTSDGNDLFPERSIEVKTLGSQKFVVFQSDLNLLVTDGRELNIENFSTGANANNGEAGRFGNVNLRSDKADVTLVSKADDGRIFIVTPNARIQITADGAVQVFGSSDVQISSDANITLDAANDVSIQGANVNIKADANVSVDAGGNFGALSSGTNTLDGGQIHFNSGMSQPVQEATLSDLEATDYGE